MRSAKTEDYWRKISKRNFNSYVKHIDLNGHNGIEKINIKPGIFAICGLNGAGKTTIISAIKDVIGMPRSIQDEMKIGDASITGTIVYNKKYYDCSNEETKRLVSDGVTNDEINFIEYSQAVTMLDFFWKQDNIEELIEQYDMSDLEIVIVREISYLVGKQYTKIFICEVEEIEGIGTIPFFKVEIDDATYDSRSMGIGEHCLMYIYWVIMKSHNDSIVILEEPESFVGIQSQINLMNFIAKASAEKGISFIITTHSPFILDKIENKNICIISRASGMTGISNPCEQMSAKTILGGKDSIKGTFFVEDDIAKLFLTILLEKEDTYSYRNYTIEVAGSASMITKVLQCPCSPNIKYKFVGIYDEDQRNIVDISKNNWPTCFLPPHKDVESTMKAMFSEPDKVKKLSEKINKSLDVILIALSQISGEDHHDWLMDFCHVISADITMILRSMYEIWKEENISVLEVFVQELKNICV